ncbi:MAG TPA: sensor histidine kinase [Thermoleophilaceae bacterium]|jgi:signal transduction histidine kinase|nr:sensor histidine kinase [Thermoleophilaceae bacterium]
MPQQRLEIVLALVLTAGVELELAGHHLLETPAQAVAAACMTLPLAVRFRWPLPTLIAVCAAWVALTALGVTSGEPILPEVALLLALYAVGSRTQRWRFWAGGAVATAGLATQLVIRDDVGFDLVLAIALPAAGLLVGRALGVLTFETDVLAERASQLELERDARIQEAIADERSRMARELHDVIGHSISVMGVQAGAVRRSLGEEHGRERDALLAIEGTGRQAVAEMRRLIGLLRTEVDGFDGPSPTLRQVERLVAEMRVTGLAIDLRMSGDSHGLSPGVDLAGYRIVQEALTNVLKHAPGSHVDVDIRRDQHELAIDVVDDGRGAAPASPADAHVGHGVVGMRERAALYRGTLEAGPRPGGGYSVSARIPLEAP